MALQLRHQTQQQRLPSATSHGVGLPVSDGGLGAASRALGQVAGAAGQIGARLARKEDALYSQRASNIYSDATIEADRLQSEIKALRDSGQDAQPLIEEFRSKFDPSGKNYPGLQQFKGDREINDKYLEPYEQKIKELYSEWDNSEKATKLVLESEQEHKKAYIPGQGLSERVIATGAVTPTDMASMVQLLETNLATPLLDGERVSEQARRARIQEPVETLENFMRVSVATVERDTNIESANGTIKALRKMVQDIPTNGHPEMEQWKANSFARLDEFKKKNESSPRVTQSIDTSVLGVKRMINNKEDSLGVIDQAREHLVAAQPYADGNQSGQIKSLLPTLAKLETLIVDPEARRLAIEAVRRGEKVFLDKGSEAVNNEHRNLVENYAKGVAERYDAVKEPLDKARVKVPAYNSVLNQIYNQPEKSLEEKMLRAKLVNDEIFRPEGTTFFGGVRHGLSPEEQLEVKKVAAEEGFQSNLEVPFIEEETQKVFARHPETNEFLSSPREMLGFINDFSLALERTGFHGPAVYAKYHDSEDVEIAEFASALRIFEATGRDMDNPVLQAYTSDTELSPETERLVDSAMSLWGSGELSDTYSKSRAAQRTLDNMGEYGLAKLIGGVQEPLIRQGLALVVKNHPNKDRAFILEEAIKYADNSTHSVMYPLRMSQAGMGQDTYLTRDMLNGMHIQSGLLDRALGAVGPDTLAHAIGQTATDNFLTTFGEGVAGVSLFELKEPGPDATVYEKTWFDTKVAVSEAWREAIGGDKTELDRLLEDGVLRYNFQGVDESGQYVTTIQVAQPNGLWRDAVTSDVNEVVSIPTKDILEPVLRDPKKFAREKTRTWMRRVFAPQFLNFR